MSSKAETASLIKYGVIVVSTLPIVALYPFTTILCQGVMIGSVKDDESVLYNMSLSIQREETWMKMTSKTWKLVLTG